MSAANIFANNGRSQYKRVKEEGTREIEKLIDEIGCADLTIKKVFRVGVPFQELISAIEDEGADLMVMGQKGRSDFAGVLFGSNAEKFFVAARFRYSACGQKSNKMVLH